jgi:hypothetical protein
VTCGECGAVLTRERAKRERAWTLADLELLARWQSRFYGDGQKLREPVQHSGGDDTGPEDERTSEWHRAATIHRRFEAMRQGIGRTHYAVLWFVIFERGSIAASLGKSLVEELGYWFATSEQRESWQSSKKRSIRTGGARMNGERLWDAAKRAWETKR